MPAKTLPELDAQYRELREGVGLLDRAARGKLVLRGAEAAEYLQGQLTNEIEALSPGTGCYAALLDRKGHVQADMRVLRVHQDELRLDLEPEPTPAALRHLQTYSIGRQIEIEDATERWTIESLIGPRAGEVSGLTDLDREHAHRRHELDGIELLGVATDVGVDLIAASGQREALRELLIAAGAVEVAEQAAEILRVESGRPRFGHEISPATMPAEAGIVDRAVSFEKGCYIGQEPVARLHYRGKPNRQLRGLRLGAMAAPGTPLFNEEREVGTISTSCLSPALGPIALAVLRREASPGDLLRVGEARTADAEVVELPFEATRA